MSGQNTIKESSNPNEIESLFSLMDFGMNSKTRDMFSTSSYKQLPTFSEVDLNENGLEKPVNEIFYHNMSSSEIKGPTNYVSLADELKTDFVSWVEERENNEKNDNTTCEENNKDPCTLLKIISLAICRRQFKDQTTQNIGRKGLSTNGTTNYFEGVSLDEETEKIVVGDVGET